MNPTPTPTTNTDGNAAADSATATAHEPEGFAEFRRESRAMFRQLEQLSRGWGLRLAIREFSDLGLKPSNASGLFLAEETARQFAGVPAGSCAALVRLESATDLPAGYWPEFIASVLCHEIAHCAVTEFDRLQGQRFPTIPRAMMAETLRLSPTEVDDAFRAEACPPWFGHELQFLRGCCHIRRRLTMAGVFTSPPWILPNAYYHLSAMSWFETCFADELQQFDGLPIAEVLREPVPAEAVALFEADVARWARSQERQQQQQRQAQPTTERDNTHGRENSQTRENSKARVLPGTRSE